MFLRSAAGRLSQPYAATLTGQSENGPNWADHRGQLGWWTRSPAAAWGLEAMDRIFAFWSMFMTWLTEHIVAFVFLAAGFGALSVFFGLIAGYAGHREAVAANEAAAMAFERAALANQKAAEASLALAILKAPRTLGQERQRSIAAAVKPFAGLRYRVAISQAADDGLAFWELLYATLDGAGWTYQPAPPPSVGNPPAGIPITAMPGVEIRFDPAKERDLEPAALALGNALSAEGIGVAVNRARTNNPNEAERDILQIVIGARVPPR